MPVSSDCDDLVMADRTDMVLTAVPYGQPFTEHIGSVEAVGAVSLPGDQVLLASAGDDSRTCGCGTR